MMTRKKEKEHLYKCTQCHKSHKSSRRLILHTERVHCDVRPFMCALCDKTYAIAKDLERHHSTLHEQQYVCMQCNKTFTRHHDLTVHIKWFHFDARPFIGSICDKTFEMSTDLDAHQISVHGANVSKSPKIRAVLASRQTLRNDVSDKLVPARTSEALVPVLSSSSRANKRQECSWCGKTYKRPFDLKIHEASHRGKRYSCNLCDKNFARPDYLSAHIRRSHSALRPYSCTTCDKTFAISYDLKIHYKTAHRRCYPCTLCMCETFSFVGLLRAHYVDVHLEVDTQDGQFVCTQCDKCFSEPSNLKSHMRWVHGVQPYTCAVCERKFDDRNRLKMHKLTHSGDKPYSCMMCVKQFATGPQLKQHHLMHSDEPRYACAVCDKTFRYKCNTKNHVRRYHPTEEQINGDTLLKDLKICEISVGQGIQGARVGRCVPTVVSYSPPLRH